MGFGTMYKQGDILLVPFPFSDLTAVKRRPVLVVSNDDYNLNGDDIVICGITSNPKVSGYSVTFGNTDLVEGQIPVSSRIKADKLFAVDKSRVVKRIATVSDNVLDKTKKELTRLFAL